MTHWRFSLSFIVSTIFVCPHPYFQPMTLALWQCFVVVVIWTLKRILFLIQPLPEETTINRNIWFIPFLHENFVRNKITFVYVGNFTSFRCHNAKEWTKAFRIFFCMIQVVSKTSSQSTRTTFNKLPRMLCLFDFIDFWAVLDWIWGTSATQKTFPTSIEVCTKINSNKRLAPY